MAAYVLTHMKTITRESLVFKPLNGSKWIDNAVVEISPHFRLSISMNTAAGRWYVGKEGSFEAAILAFEEKSDLGDLVWVDNDTVTRNCGMDDINRLAEIASKLVYVGRIEVFDVADRSIDPTLCPRWYKRFFCAAGKDLSIKIKYADRIWGKEKYKFIPAEAT